MSCTILKSNRSTKGAAMLLLLLLFAACGEKEEASVRATSVAVQQDTTLAATGTVGRPDTKTLPDHQAACGFDNPVADLGEGILMAASTLRLFNDSLLRQQYTTWAFDKNEEPESPVCSKFYKPDYGYVHLVCLAVYPDCYKVLINYDQVCFVARSGGHQFQSWKQYITSIYGIGLNEKSEQANLFLQPDDHSEVLLPLQDVESFCPVDVKGDYLRLVYNCAAIAEDETGNCAEHLAKCPDQKTGWMRWRKGNETLIEFFLMP